jgi:chromate transport protein ChrA
MTKMTQIVGSFAAVMVYALTTTAIVWKVPNSGNWVLGVTLVLAAIVLAFCYRAARRAVPPDFKGGKWAATVLILGGDAASNNVTPTQRAVGFFILMGVILTGIVLALVWPDRPSWVLWAQTSLMLAVASFFIVKAARNTTPPA